MKFALFFGQLYFENKGIKAWTADFLKRRRINCSLISFINSVGGKMSTDVLLFNGDNNHLFPLLFFDNL
jgi:hypothetical protein